MTAQINYNEIAPVYAQTRTAAPHVVKVLTAAVDKLPAGATVVELGCGTGNHLRALAATRPEYHYLGFDQSTEMLKVAMALAPVITFLQGDAQLRWPLADQSAHLVFNVDVIHYIKDLPTFFGEAQRVLQPNGLLLIATDSEADLRSRSLTLFFPEILVHELARYPQAAALYTAAQAVGLHAEPAIQVERLSPISPADIDKLAAKSSSALRLISDEAHQRGLARVRAAQANGESWRSLYTIHHFYRAARD